jgi:hypothetical protein
MTDFGHIDACLCFLLSHGYASHKSLQALEFHKEDNTDFSHWTNRSILLSHIMIMNVILYTKNKGENENN